MKNSLIKVLSFVMALTMIVGCFSAITFSAAEHTHTKGEQVGEPVPATCANIGYTLYKCATCGATYADDVVPKAKDHTGIVEIPATEATCTYPAMTAGKTCTDCGKVIEGWEPVKDSNPLGHDFVRDDEGTAVGTDCVRFVYSVCKNCGLTYEGAKAADAKDKVLNGNEEENLEGLKDKYPDIKWATYDEKWAKKDEGKGHTYSYTVKTAPETCKDGVTVGTCTKCGDVKEITIKAEHSYIFDNDHKFLSCEGYIGYKCVLCGAPHSDAKVNENPEHKWERVASMNSTLQGMGYTAVEVPATCTTAGYYIQKCKCGEYREVPSDATGHTYGAWTSDGGKLVNTTSAVNNSAVCVSAKTLTRKCTKCDAKETKVGVAAKEHVLVSNVTASTCTDEGFTVLKCIYPSCTYTVTNNYTAKLGHSFGDWETVGSANDHTKDYKKVRTCARCSEKEEQMIIAAITVAPEHTVKIGDHYFIDDKKSDTVVAANCTTPAYKAYVCVVEGCSATTPINGTPDASKINADLDTSVHDPEQLGFLETVKKPTCTATGLDKYFCKKCSTPGNTVVVDIVVESLAKDHNDPSKWVTKTYKANGAIDKDVSAVEATCTSTGKEAGAICPLCNTIVKPQTTTPIDSTNHKTLQNKVLVEVKPTEVTNRKATCSSIGYIVNYYSCCKQYDTEYPSDSDYSEIKAGAHDWKEVAYKAATCGVNGNHAYKECKECGEIEITCTCGVDHTNLLVVEIVATPHNFVENDDTKAKPETCTEAGYTAHKVCTKCGVTEGKVIIPAHGDAYRKDLEYKAPTHTETGIKEGNFCTVCDKKPVAEGGYIISALGHDASFSVPVKVNPKGTKNYDCTLPTYNVYTCSCGATYADKYEAAVKSEHIYEAVWHKYTVSTDGKKLLHDGVDTGKYACAADAYTYEYRECQNCEQIEKKNVQAPINHYYTVNGTKVDILLDCQNIENSIGLVCENCKTQFTADHATHNVAFSEKKPTCTEDGYIIRVCADCGQYLDENYKVVTDPADIEKAWKPLPAPGHKPYLVKNQKKPYGPDNFTPDPEKKNLYIIDKTNVVYVVEEKAPTFGADGYIKYMCANCNEVVTYVIPYNTGIELGMTATPGFTGNQVAVTVKVSAKDFKFQTITLDVYYSNGLALADKKLELDYVFPVVDNVTPVAKDNSGFATVTIYAPNDVATGKAINTVISGENVALVTLYFDVLPYANNAGFGLEVSELKAVNDKGELEDIKANVSFDVNTIDTNNNNHKLKDYMTTLVGDANGDGYIDAADSVAVMEANYTAVYNAALDFNADGTVDLDDHMALINYYISGRTYFDFLELIGVDYMDYVNNYDLRVDLDGDKAVTDNDRNRIAIELVNELKAVSVEDGKAFDINGRIGKIVEDLLDDGLRNNSSKKQ